MKRQYYKENDFAVRQAMGSETTYGLKVHSRLVDRTWLTVRCY